MMMRQKRMLCFCGLLSLILLAPGFAAIRTWTSVSGTAVEAEFVEEADGYVVLSRTDGEKIKIRKSSLCAEDREYIDRETVSDEDRQLSTRELEEEFRGAAGSDELQALVVRENDEISDPVLEDVSDSDKPLFHGDSFASPGGLVASNFPALKLTHPQESVFIGLQYGPASNNVVYLAFDRESSEKLPELNAFIYSQGMSIYTNGATVRGRKSRREDDRTVEFKNIEVKSHFGEVLVKADITFIFGVRRPDVLYVTADVMIEKGGQAAKFMIGRELTDALTSVSDEIKAVHLFGEPRMNVVARWRNVYAGVFLGDWMLIPVKGMDRKMVVYVKDGSGKTQEDERVNWGESVIFDVRHTSDWHCCRPKALQKEGVYRVGVAINLGDILGSLEKETDYTVKP